MQPPVEVQILDDYLLCLLKTIYGLKQSRRQWNLKFHKYIFTLGFIQSIPDYCIYTRIRSKDVTIQLLYVDDILLCGDDEKEIANVKMQLSSEFKMEDLELVKQFMGLNVTVDQDSGTLTIDQTHYAEKILKGFGMLEFNPIATPVDPKLKLDHGDCLTKTEKPFRVAFGFSMILMIGSRPDICYAISCLSRF